MVNKTCRTCRICGSIDCELVTLEERMYGTRERFDYHVCHVCGAYQIADVPDCLNAYYPADYYSFSGRLTALSRLKHGVAGLAWRLGVKALPPGHQLIRFLDLLPATGGRVLDIGSGSGLLLHQLSYYGYECVGVDPYIADERRDGRVMLLKRSLEDVEGPFQLIISIHSLEHMPDPHAVFAYAKKALDRGGHLVVRVPVLPNNVESIYGSNWPQFDPPRHLYVFTAGALRMLADMHGFVVCSSERVGKPWSLAVARAYSEGFALTNLTAEERAGTPEDAEATRLANAAGYGDEILLVMRLACNGD